MLRVIVALLLLYVTTSSSNPQLLFPKNSVFQFTIGVSVPITTNKRGTISFSAGFQFNYALPWNLTQLQLATIIPARDANDLHLHDIYQAIENLLDKYGWLSGRQCLLRSICELAETPLGKTGPDIVEEIIQLLLTPSEDFAETINLNQLKLYQEAELLGRFGGDCVSNYPDCIQSPLESFTNIVFSSISG